MPAVFRELVTPRGRPYVHVTASGGGQTGKFRMTWLDDQEL
jgi:hypothetical protein